MSQEPSANKPQSRRLRFEFYNLAKKKKNRGGELVIQMHHEMKEILIICLEGREKRGKRREWKDKTYIIFFVFFEREFQSMVELD